MAAIPKRLLTLSLAAVAAFFPLAGFASSKETFQFAPINPSFAAKTTVHAVSSATSDDHVLGYRPGPVVLSLPRESCHTRSVKAALPAAYDLRTLNRVSPVRDQGTCGACWTFATLASVESALLPDESWDFSENHLRNNHLFDWSPCSGGNASISTANLVRWNGPVLEADDPYTDQSNKRKTGLPVQKHSQDVLYLPERENPLDNLAIKESLRQNGGLYVGLSFQESLFNDNRAAYYNSRNEVANHAVTIVGWDDNYSRDNFLKKPPGNGAFIAKNSWGTNWGDEGYFYISYYDRTLTEFTAFVKPEAANNYQTIYQYDELGLTGSLGGSKDTGWFANIFPAQRDGRIKAAGFYTLGHDATYEVKVYTDVDPKKGPLSGNLASTSKGTLAYMGYHTVQLPDPAEVKAGTSFAVVAKVTVPGNQYPIPVENRVKGYSSKASSGKNQSFFSANGDRWIDVMTLDSTANVTLKAYADEGTTGVPVALDKIEIRDAADQKKMNSMSLKLADGPASLIVKASYKDASTANVTAQAFVKSISNPAVIDVKQEGDSIILTPKKTGSAKVQFTFEKKSASLTIRVK
ncbi:lectin like domain-containing protein [Brevibacillus fluminis]|uniref:lectin like domain-containing protein n=1 Tax=Brevibacillus fluminis TaxID=511487 RepID=UPI001605BDA8|nr:lectin like domain-containing protein [Brevibacillus fluminis]